jgi:hypothetical protein
MSSTGNPSGPKAQFAKLESASNSVEDGSESVVSLTSDHILVSCAGKSEDVNYDTNIL